MGRFPGLMAVLVLILTGLCGCGASMTTTRTLTTTTTAQATGSTVTVFKHLNVPVTSTTTATVTRTITAPASGTTANGGFASTYPASFENSFATSCVNTGGTPSACGCTLKRIEATVPFSTVLADNHAIVTGSPPSWYTSAEASCAGR